MVPGRCPKALFPSDGWLVMERLLLSGKSTMGHPLRPLTRLAQAPNSFEPRFQMQSSITAWNGMGPAAKSSCRSDKRYPRPKLVSPLVLSLHLFPAVSPFAYGKPLLGPLVLIAGGLIFF